MKKVFALLLSFVLLLSLLPRATVFASSAPTIVCEDVVSEAGKQITVTVSIVNNPGFSYLELTPTYSEELTFVKVENGELVSDFTKGKQYVWTADEDVTEDGILLTFTFDIADTVSEGEYSIGFILRMCGNYDEEPVNFTVKNATITVTCPHTDTTNIPEESADCDEDGYTAGVWCNGCEDYISGHESIPATGIHIDADDQWESNEVYHFRTCDCGHIFDTAAHNGGTATCKEKAKCSVCGEEYGQLNADNHAGGTTTVNASEADHKTQTAGYTGDTKCLGCGVIIAYGRVIPADAHTPASNWTTDANYHWKECNIGSCGAVISGSKAAHSSTGANVATCQKKAVCDICGVSYGTVASHNFSDWVVVNATSHGRNCTVCEKQETADHSFVDGICTDCALKLEYTVIFRNEDGTELSKATYHYGDKVTAPADPEKAPTATGKYTFIGWDPEITVVTGDAIYTAKFAFEPTLPDFTGDGQVTDADAVYLLRYTLFPSSYPLNADGDVNGDGQITDADAVYLLRHTLFPQSYPLYPSKKIALH